MQQLKTGKQMTIKYSHKFDFIGIFSGIYYSIYFITLYNKAEKRMWERSGGGKRRVAEYDRSPN